MIAFGCVTEDERRFRAHARPSMERVVERDSVLMRRRREASVYDAYNEMLAKAAEYETLEAVVLARDDVSIDGDAFLPRIRALFAASPEVAVIGVVGARAVSGLAWWEGECHGYVDLPTVVPGGTRLSFSEGPHEVEVVDGHLIVLSAWAARELRFDTGLGAVAHGGEADICLQARARGKQVIADGGVGVSHLWSGEHVPDRGDWVRACVALRRKWGLVGQAPMPAEA